ncbi:type VI secretion system protein TssA [Rubrimonas cliftonensis]|uniref:Type VI secretion system protein ImpL/type VI secretion system protein ImpA n=1 Tax=Rubrimonas cliftonensis TaxID=89524 RepID=A0A1H3WVG0_9RHOB|nr:type VI secretion system protein TssA [Rubrimonas cliftonensis]SDZ90322.1 type VI secretion system protein ImpL/type VI secretion system protein ImpA [Rubrimonas cliftonensis]
MSADVATTFAGLLDPLPGPEPTGPSLRYGPVHAAIEEARREEDADLPQGVWQRDVKRADDAHVVALCRDALATKSKDLLVACWLVDAAVRDGGFAAAAAGMRFVAALCETFWEGMHPAHDGDADSPRYGPIVWLDGALARAARLAPIARGEREGERVALSWSHYEQARHGEAAQRRARSSRKADAAHDLTIGEFDALADATPEAALLAFDDALTAADAAAEALEAALTRLAGDAAPSMTALRRAAREVGGLVGPILARRRPATPVAPPPAPASGAAAASETATSAAPSRAPAAPVPAIATDGDREHAYRALIEIAALLRRIEPHSPTPYLIERAVRWGGMTLADVLRDLPKEGRDPEMLNWLMAPAAKK